MKDFHTVWKTRLEKIERVLEETLPHRECFPAVIHEAMRYSTLGAGKRLRALLVMAACEAVGGELQKTYPLAVALEMIHAYSLIHDDLPCMDDDDLRRGKPTNHKVYGEAVAVLAGDALLTEAFAVLASAPAAWNIPAETMLDVISELAQGAGSRGMVGGQVVDIQAQGQELSLDMLSYIHNHKTGALIKAAVRGGALVGGCSTEQLSQITVYGKHFGLAFQITDDILDEIGHTTRLGKAVGSDYKLNKQTFPRLYGLEQSWELARENVAKCWEALAGFPEQAWFLRELAAFILQRDH